MNPAPRSRSIPLTADSPPERGGRWPQRSGPNSTGRPGEGCVRGHTRAISPLRADRAPAVSSASRTARRGRGSGARFHSEYSEYQAVPGASYKDFLPICKIGFRRFDISSSVVVDLFPRVFCAVPVRSRAGAASSFWTSAPRPPALHPPGVCFREWCSAGIGKYPCPRVQLAVPTLAVSESASSPRRERPLLAHLPRPRGGFRGSAPLAAPSPASGPPWPLRAGFWLPESAVTLRQLLRVCSGGPAPAPSWGEMSPLLGPPACFPCSSPGLVLSHRPGLSSGLHGRHGAAASCVHTESLRAATAPLAPREGWSHAPSASAHGVPGSRGLRRWGRPRTGISRRSPGVLVPQGL